MLQYNSRPAHSSYLQQARRTWLLFSLVRRNEDVFFLIPYLRPQVKILSEDTGDNPDESRVLLHAHTHSISDKELEQQKRLKLISDHKR